jgi:hypothetical protein
MKTVRRRRRSMRKRSVRGRRKGGKGRGNEDAVMTGG